MSAEHATVMVALVDQIRDKLTDYWSRNYNHLTAFYGNAMKRDRYFNILLFLHFTNKNEPDISDESADRLWKINV